MLALSYKQSTIIKESFHSEEKLVTKFVLLPFVLALLGLVCVAVFAPRSAKIGDAAEEATEHLRSVPLWIGGICLTLAVLSVTVHYWVFGGTDSVISTLFTVWYCMALMIASFVCFIWWGALMIFAAGVPVAQEVGENLTEEQRRTLWRGARRFYRKYRAS